jgi:hypothetical protein
LVYVSTQRVTLLVAVSASKITPTVDEDRIPSCRRKQLDVDSMPNAP